MDISIGKLFWFYVDTLERCGTFLLPMTDEEIGYNVFEEFDVGTVSFLHGNTLDRL